MTPNDYNKAELVAGRLTIAHITTLVRYFQSDQASKGYTKVIDGMAGPVTRALIEKFMSAPVAAPAGKFLHVPLPTLGARVATVTSEFRPADRPDHDGVDWFFRWEAGDQPSTVGDHGAAGRNADGTPRWVVPFGVSAIAAADGVVQMAGDSTTGHRVWVDHGNGWRTGYFHLLDLKVSVGQRVSVGAPLGLVGDNPSDNDGRHLHFELSPVDRYSPTDPVPHLIR